MRYVPLSVAEVGLREFVRAGIAVTYLVLVYFNARSLGS